MEKKPKLCQGCKLQPRLPKGVWCAICRASYDKGYFKQHSIEKSSSASSRKRAIVDWYRKLKESRACFDCFGKFLACQMDFDHVPGRGSKFMDVSKMVRLGYEVDKIAAEINKCDLLCKNCHALRTWKRLQGKKASAFE